MAGPIVYIDRSDVTQGYLASLRAAVTDLVAFVEAREPRLIAYGFYINDVGSTMTVIDVHPVSASLEFHLEIGGSESRKVGAFIRLRAIEVFGQPSDTAVIQLREKAKTLGNATVVVHAVDAGFARMPSP